MDPIADMLIRIKNAQVARKEMTSFGYSKVKWEIAKILERVGYCKAVNRKGKKNRKLIEIELLYNSSGVPKITGVRRMSSPGRRVYKGFREIYAPRSGFGISVYSTPKGILTDRDTAKEAVGGEFLFEIW